MPRPLSDDEAWIVSHNLGLVGEVLRGRRRDSNVWEDLRAAGYMGLCHAVSLYDPARGHWVNYAKRWIRKYVQMERASLPIVWVPVYHGSHPGTETYGKEAGLAAHARSIRWDDPEAANALAVTPRKKPSRKNQRLVSHCLDELKPKQREVISRVVMFGEKTADVAHDIGVSRQWVEKVKKQAIQKLRHRMLEDRPEWALP